MNEFNWTTAPLSGKSLIEASAGTGKTFMISRIYLRLLLERKLSVQEILVVTFTEAATNELKDRIYKMLLTTRDGFWGQEVEDAALQKYINSHLPAGDARERLTIALQDFDEASVFTIHTFCNRVLQENAFESGGVFDTELMTEQTGLLNETVEDFWRQKIYTQSGMFLSYVLAKISPDKLYKFVEKNIGRLSFKIVPEKLEAESDISQHENEFLQSFQFLGREWLDNQQQIADALVKHGGLKIPRFNPNNIQNLFENLNNYLNDDSGAFYLFETFENLTPTILEKFTRKNFDPPDHTFFQSCERHHELHKKLTGIFDDQLILLKKELFVFVTAELKRKKEERNVFFFDDIILDLYTALNDAGESLSESVRSKFKAALIDEFQDTDPAQYDIFSKIFDHPDATLFLIGDPKQAIYGFRGADIFAYMKAKTNANENARFTLTTNYRSEPGLIQGVNHIFSATGNAFIYPEIPFQNAVAAEISDRARLKIQGGNTAPLQLWFYDPEASPGSGQKNNKDTSKAIIAEAVADEIVRLLELGKSGQATIDNVRVEEKDVAVLVRTHAESGRVQKALRKRNVHSVLYATDNLFASHEALELERVLLAVASPKNIGRMKTALSTEMFGLDANAILQLDAEGDALEEWLTRFAAYHQSWRDFGFVRMINDLLKKERLLIRLMAFEDGERRITNLLHLSDVLNENSSKNQLGINGLLKWLTEQRTLIDKSVKEHQIRLESDENTVKLITTHMSKGLEFPIVFCPFAWGGSTIRSTETLEFHDENDELNFTIDLGSPALEWDLHKKMAEKELLAENLRLLYVAITRARNRCYLVWGDLPSAKTSGLAYLLHKPTPFDASQPVDALRKHLKNTKADGFLQRAKTLTAQSGGAIALKNLLPAEINKFSAKIESQDKLRNKKFTTLVDTKLRISSYSGLVSTHPHGAELADYDALEITIKSEPVEMERAAGEFNNFMSFPRGSKAGTFLHDLLQRLDFSNTRNESTTALVFEKLREFGFNTQWQGIILDLFDRLMKANLKSPSDQFTLAKIEPNHCLQELEFYFPVLMLSPQKLQAVFEKYGEDNTEFVEKLGQINFTEFKGFMKGFIDLIFQKNGRFYILDWKSNYLGVAFKNYDAANLTQEMSDRLYVLQYHLYTLALNNYLSWRLPGYDYEKHFGGVFYIFMRGVEPEKAPDCGIYFDRPAQKIIVELAKTMMGQS